MSLVRRLAAALYYPLFRAILRVRFLVADAMADDRTPPAYLRYRVSESLSVDQFISIGAGCAMQIDALAGEMGVPFSRPARVLDFGCGCGRTLRWFLANRPLAQFAGADVDADAIAWCQQRLALATFHLTAARPPLPFAAREFDAVYALSVFTHLDRERQTQWLAELHRILRPGGALIFSVHGPAAARVLSPADQSALQSAGFLHKTSRKLRGLHPDWYQTTWHTRDDILAQLEALFPHSRYVPVPGSAQDFVVALKPMPR